MGLKAVFLDRDNTIARDVPYCSRPEDFELLSDADTSIKLLNQNNFKVVVITNQSGIARGYFDETMLHKIHQKMTGILSLSSATIDGIYYCPHHPDEGCSCRKPSTKLLELACKELGLDPLSSYVVGDSNTDIEMGKNAGCTSVLIRDNCQKQHQNEIGADFIAPNLYSAILWIIEHSKNREVK